MTQLAEPRSLESPLAAAMRHFQAGRIADAETICRDILALDGDQPDLLHLLGAIRAQSDDHDSAIELICLAIRLSPGSAIYYDTLGRSLKARGRLTDAVAAYREALRIKPDFAAALNNLGVALRALGNLEESQSAFRDAIRIAPNFAAAHRNLGALLVKAGQHGDAIAPYEIALRINPNDAEAWNNYGIALCETGALGDSIAAIGRALQIRPGYAEAYNNLGYTLRKKGQLAEAIAVYQKAIELKPAYAEAYNNLAVALWESGLHDHAIIACQKALNLKSDFPEACNSLGNILKDCGDFDGAVVQYERALSLNPSYAEAHGNLAVVLKDQGLLDDAVDHARRAIALRPDHAAHSNLIYLLHFHPDADSSAIAREQSNWHRLHAEPLASRIVPYVNIREAGRRLRIGYIAPYFRNHVVGLNILPLLREHNHQQFEIFCYSDVIRPDSITRQFQGYADCWQNIVGLTDDRAADLIRRNQIDILVDLSQHLSSNRLLVMARKPASVQASFAGYPAGAGLKTIDYRITDRFLDPPAAGSNSFEKPAYISSFWCYDEAAMSTPACPIPEPNPLPAASVGHITFGCLNNFCKTNDRVIELWACVLHAVPGSRLLMLCPAGSSRQRVCNLFAQFGIASHHIEFTSHQCRKMYLELYHRIDIGLDTFPYNGHTTSLDSLWMGVPVVSLAGASSVGRAGVSQLNNLGLTDLIAQTPEEFVRIAKDLAEDIHRLGALRSSLREKMRNSPISDAKRFTGEIESAYRAMWQACVAAA